MKTRVELKKLKDAESLCSSNTHEDTNKAIRLYKEMCLSNLDPFDKNKIMSSFWRNVKDEARDMLIRWRDMIPFVSGDALAALTKLLLLICENTDIEDHERSITAVHLYNQGFLHVCFRGFESIALDTKCKLEYRIDACRFLIGSEQEENRELAQECLLDIINGDDPSSEKRYKIIAGFITRTGISTYLNATKIKIPYDENFVYGLQMAFFERKENGVRERILSGQHILGMQEASSSDDKEEVTKALLDMANNEAYDENVRADAADVVLRLGSASATKLARDIIIKLGYSGIGKGGAGIDRIKMIYNNSQNMHDEKISESVSVYIEKMVGGLDASKILPFDKVRNSIMELVKDRGYDPKQKHKVKAALNRVSIDTATFTSLNLTLCDILSCVWLKICEAGSSKDNTRRMLEDRLLEELSEMGPTCSSGHSGRFVNVLSAVDNTLSISFEDQIIANVAGRINARIRGVPDPDAKMSIQAGMFPQADEEDIVVYKKFIEGAIVELREEMHKEFVGDGYVSEAEFTMYFNRAIADWSL
jgi:hypothetical protein